MLNYYGPSAFDLTTTDGRPLRIVQETDYPRSGVVRMRIASGGGRATLALRIPAWSRATRVAVNGVPVDGARPGSYLTLDREWSTGDEVRLDLDFSLRTWIGEREAEGKVSIYRGPILLAYDQRLNSVDPDSIPPIRLDALDRVASEVDEQQSATLLTVAVPTEREDLILCDFASAGAAGNPYRTWLQF